MKVLVADDSSFVRRRIREELEAGGYEILEAEDGMQALEILMNETPDLITLDVEMPNMTGYETCLAIRKMMEEEGRNEDLPIVFVTTNDTIEGREQGFIAGATEFVTKSSKKGELLKAVNRYLKPGTEWTGLTALIVDDSKSARFLTVQVLKKDGINFIEAESGEEGLEILKERRDEISLVITDYAMLGMNGVEFCQAIRNDLKMTDLAIIFLTGVSEKSSVLNIFKAGASDYIVKPFVKEELLSRIKMHAEAKLLNQKLNQKILELEKIDKQKDNLLGVITHDLRAPLNGILGFVDILREMNEEEYEHKENEQHDFLKQIQKSGSFLLELINDLLELNSLHTKTVTTNTYYPSLNINDIIKESILHTKNLAKQKDISLGFKNDLPEDTKIKGSKNSLIRVFNNLLTNATKFTPEGGIINVSILESQKEILIEVDDNGVGIPHDLVPKIFDRFTRITNYGTAGERGTGLGLKITKEIIEQHNGVIKIIEKQEAGAKIHVLLPHAKNASLG
ncbi:MAG: CheY-like chemotaxis protein/two-component sensor histidine kinase [bacterium]|jgi:CheY-like chemotaxis protein/two-component sensor histidine kinase